MTKKLDEGGGGGEGVSERFDNAATGGSGRRSRGNYKHADKRGRVDGHDNSDTGS